MAVTKRKEAERAVLRCAVEAAPAIYAAYQEIQSALNDERVNPGAVQRMENEAEALVMLGEAINRYATLPKRSVDAPSPAVRDDATDTSRLAARRVTPRHGTLRRSVYEQILWRPHLGMTDLELEDLLGVTHQSVSSARNSLVENGWLYDSGERRALHGRKAIVWKAVAE